MLTQLQLDQLLHRRGLLDGLQVWADGEDGKDEVALTDTIGRRQRMAVVCQSALGRRPRRGRG
jgi:hypothetical protein